MAPPRATLASLQKSVSEILGKLKGLEEVVAAVRESVEEVQTQAVSDHDSHVGMCQQLQRSVDDLMQRDSGSDGGGVSRSQRADAKNENAAWRTDVIRRFWILTAERPAMFDLKRSELQAVLAEVTAVTDRVTNQLNTLTGFSVTDYMAEGDDTSAVGDMFLPEQMDVMVQSLLTVIGTGVESDTGVERMQTLARAFHEGADTLRPFPAVGATAAAAAPAVVAAQRVRVPGPGVVCVFQPLPRLLPVLDEDAGSVGRRGQPWSPRGAYPRRGFMRGNGRGRRCNLSQVWLRVCGSAWLPLTVWQRSKGVGGLSRQ